MIRLFTVYHLEEQLIMISVWNVKVLFVKIIPDLFFFRPTAMFMNPLEHSSIEVQKCMSLDANEVLVVYKQNDKSKSVTRYLKHGPTVFMPAANEWYVCQRCSQHTCELLCFRALHIVNLDRLTMYRRPKLCGCVAGCMVLNGMEPTRKIRPGKFRMHCNLQNFGLFPTSFIIM